MFYHYTYIYKFYLVHAGSHHTAYNVIAAAANADDLDSYYIRKAVSLERHIFFPQFIYLYV